MVLTLETPQKREISDAEMKQILSSQGVKFEPKERRIKIPLITDQTLNTLFSDRSKESARLAIKVMDDYLTGEVIVDQWGNNHNARKKWQNEMMEKYPGIFEQVYYRPNMLRSNLMTAVIMAIQQIPRFLNSNKSETLRSQLKPLTYDLLNEVNGVNTGILYKDMSLDQKIQVVRIFEDKIIDVYKILSGSDAKTVPAMIY